MSSMNHGQMASKGLAGVVVDETAISDVRAEGALIYRGHPIETLVEQPFTQVAALVVTGELSARLDRFLAAHANLAPWETAAVLNLPETSHPMQVLSSLLPVLDTAPVHGLNGLDDDAVPGLVAAAKVPALVATHLTRAEVHLDPALGYCERFLRAINPDRVSPELLTAFNLAQVLQLEHSFNAGTFAARVVASTLADVQSAMAAGVGALSGPLHGGADQAAIEIADSLADASAARAYVDATLAEGGRVPGMGHREYRARDPRARVLEAWARRLVAAHPEHTQTLTILETLDGYFRERMSDAGKEVHANVEFYKGLVYRIVGLPNHFFTAGFAMARVFGYVAHFAESRLDNRIYRPAAHYVGPG